MKKLAVIICLFAFAKAYTQQIYPEHYEGCNTERFILESKVEKGKIDSDAVVTLLLKDLSEKQLKKLKGTLTFQVLANTDATSCLLSAENKTNIKSKTLGLKSKIDALIWEIPPKEKTASIFTIKFKKGKYRVSRLGIHGDLGIHKLKPFGS
ncbi:hypothetical protein [uncultured Dokdonia sp.]|uniref:hypothetical protein n=1 Tax=uncultured Dokdonia sp. TaxID=575653 RepID=UPI002610085E|nr:hypothetical protein [uncultured Dokdonia sp.]